MLVLKSRAGVSAPASGEKHVAAEGRASHLPSCSCGYSSRPAPARLLVSDTGSARRDRPGPRLQPAGVSGEHWMRPAGTAGGGDTSSPCALSGRRRRVPGNRSGGCRVKKACSYCGERLRVRRSWPSADQVLVLCLLRNAALPAPVRRGQRARGFWAAICYRRSAAACAVVRVVSALCRGRFRLATRLACRPVR